jgi:hypothetical protein
MELALKINIDRLVDNGHLSSDMEEAVVKALAERLEHDFLIEGGKMLAKRAENILKAKTELLINTILEKPVHVSTGWQTSDREYDSVYDMVEEMMTKLYDNKFRAAKGGCEKDPLLANIQKYVDGQVERELRETSKKIELMGKVAAKQAVEESQLVKAVKIAMGVDDEEST